MRRAIIWDGINEPAASKLLKMRGSYGCNNYSPTDLPEGETPDSQMEHKLSMQASFARGAPNDQTEILITKTYYSQRFDILCKTIPIFDPQSEWPYQFETEEIFPHFEEFTSIEIREKWQSSLTGKGERVLQWMSSQHQNKELPLMAL